MIFRQKAMLRTAIRPKRKVVAGRTLRNGVARRGYCGVPVNDFRASFPLPGMTLSVVLGRTPWRATRGSCTDCREYMPYRRLSARGRRRMCRRPQAGRCSPPHRAAAGCRSSATAENAYFVTKRWRQKCPQGTSVGIGRRFSLSGHARSTPFAHTRSGRSNRRSICSRLRCNAEDVVRFAQR